MWEGWQGKKHNANTTPRLPVRATKEIIVLFWEMRRLEELVWWEVDIFCCFGQCLSCDLVLLVLLSWKKEGRRCT